MAWLKPWDSGRPSRRLRLDIADGLYRLATALSGPRVEADGHGLRAYGDNGPTFQLRNDGGGFIGNPGAGLAWDRWGNIGQVNYQGRVGFNALGANSPAVVTGFFGPTVLVPNSGAPIAQFGGRLPPDLQGTVVTVNLRFLSPVTGTATFGDCRAAAFLEGDTWATWNIESGVSRSRPGTAGVFATMRYTLAGTAIRPGAWMSLMLARTVPDGMPGTVYVGPCEIEYTGRRSGPL